MDILSITVLFGILLVATYTDMRSREVPDWISYSGVAAGIGLSISTSISLETAQPLLQSIAGILITGALGLALYYSGQWGGGDCKLLIALGALLGVTLSLNTPLLSFIIALILVGGAYGILWVSAVATKNYTAWIPHAKQALTRKTTLLPQIAITILVLVLIIALALLPLPLSSKISAGIALTLLPALLLLLTTLKVIEKHCLIKNTPVNQLVEGDWIPHHIIKNNTELYTPQKSGITHEDIQRLQAAKITSVPVKIGMPFVPAFLVALVITTAFGNVLLLLL